MVQMLGRVQISISRAPGRPKKLRRREFDEPRNETIIGKRHISMKAIAIGVAESQLTKVDLHRSGSSVAQTSQANWRSKSPIKSRGNGLSKS
ncbi:unnamed protein product [Citrullus colocynthis]|uniref:Uncharacterized protein n=1 Tax=Citrullus colocynthis TaxID=252529 RepID=A0ABP0Z6Y6_9ROSI